MLSRIASAPRIVDDIHSKRYAGPGQSPTVWNIVRQALLSHVNIHWNRIFARTGVVLSKALVDLGQVRELVNLWDQSSPDTAIDRRVGPSVGAVVFRHKITITSDGEVGG
jgi:hypothetical protein